MTRRAWVRLDNASNIFLAARSDADPKVFRLSAEVDHDVDPALLQQALDTTYERYPLYHAVLRRGVFWYYLQDSDLRPTVTEDEQHTCAPIYQADRLNLLFRVMHHRRRVILEIFHALSDGTGALWFLSDLLAAYTRLRDPEHPPEGDAAGEAHADPPSSEERLDPSRADAAPRPGDDAAGPVHELTADSFAHYFRRRRGAEAPAAGSAFSRAATPAALTVAESAPPAPEARWSIRSLRRRPGEQVHRVRGTRTPDNRTRAVELTAPAQEVLALARAEGVALTMYLTALFFEAVRSSSGGLGRARTIAASVPVNLRQFYPSTSARNFFATVRVAHTYGEGADDLGSICRRLEAQFRPKASPEALGRKLRRFIRFERMIGLRIVPRPLKDVLLGLINWANNRGLSVAVSNLGRVTLPEPAESRVGRMLFHVSAVRPQFCAISHAGLLTITFTSPFTETDHIREFARLLTSRGIDVTVAAARVTEAELAEEEL
ncbi:alcohol acetyltransferase [Leucobacter tenebrionis]|uniref:alcohol acetyltransferase n=1 Tax=Leucobacter tenebrionis TaxID=2873270 RepID=UPI001CA6BF8B|nr:alcohol acetyltransferase [Leucobacter tenebrionis]QZY51245.1 alcohol acetyltransferase [Leucobacter tenebrionis]